MQTMEPQVADIPLYPMGYGGPCASPIVICRYNDKTHALSPLHRHEVIQINYIVRGQLLHQINGNCYGLVAGDLFVIPPDVPHQLVDTGNEGYDIFELEFRPEAVFGRSDGAAQTVAGSQAIYDFSYIEPFLVSERNVRPRLHLTGKAQLQAESLLEDLLREFQAEEDGYQLAMKADLSMLLVFASRAFQAELRGQPEALLFERHREAMGRTIRFIDEHFAEPLALEDVTRMALLSQTYFSYLFKTLTGKTFVEYLNDLRMKRAMELLQTTNQRVLDIACQSGFNSVNYFNRLFKNAVGVSPRQYRNACRSSIPTETAGQTEGPAC